MSVYELSDEQGNKCYVDNRSLAFSIVTEKQNPFINIVEVVDENKINKEHIISDYDEFCNYFY